MGWFRKHARDDTALQAAAAAVTSREAAEAELARQRSAADREDIHVLSPLRRMRERNHIAEDFIDLIRQGYS
jgi:hypothetical protein